MRSIVRVLKTPITLIALVCLVGYAASWGWANALAPVPPAPPEPCVVRQIGPELSTRDVTIRVLNGGFSGGAARRMGTVLRSWGLNIIKINNTNQRIATTTIVGRSADDPQVKLVAGFFKSPVIQADNRVDGTVDVLIGATFPGYVEKPATSIPLPDGTACLPKPAASTISVPPASPSASPSPSPSKSKKKG